MKHPRSVFFAALAACCILLAGCGPKKPELTRIISAKELLTAEDCTGLYKVPFKLTNEQFMGHNPPTLERDHVTMIDYQGEHGEMVSITLDQSVSLEESKKRGQEHRAAYEKEPKFRDVPGFGQSGGWQSGHGHRINFSRAPYRVAVQVIEVGGEEDDAKQEERMRHFAKIVDERLKKLAPPQP